MEPLGELYSDHILPVINIDLLYGIIQAKKSNIL